MNNREKQGQTLEANAMCIVFCPVVETRPDGAVQEAEQCLLGGRQLHPQPHQGRVHLHHLQHNIGAVESLGEQNGGPQEDL